jgi:hypothetical protein
MAAMWPSLWPKVASVLTKKAVKDKTIKNYISLLQSEDSSQGEEYIVELFALE